MVELPNLLVFIAALAAVYVLPGPDMALVISTSASRGPRSGLMAALGLALARTLHVTLSALGLAALFHAHPLLFDAVRWIGAAYLAWLAWKMLGIDGGAAAQAASEAGAGWKAVQRGMLTNLLNPKALMFCALLLPQFISTQHALAAQYLLLGSVLVGLGLLFDVAFALAASGIARRVAGVGALRRVARRVCSGIFGLTALRLALGAH